MSYAIRNTLIITAFWAILICVGGYYIFGHQNRIHTRLIKEKTAKMKKLEELHELDRARLELDDYLKRLLTVDRGSRGVLVSSETPGETFDYMVRELNRVNSTVQFDLKTKETKQTPELGIHEYEILGEGGFVDVYRLLWFLENGPVFYKIESVEIRKLRDNDFLSGRVSPQAEVRFVFKVRAYQRDGGPRIETLNLDKDHSLALANMFKPTGTRPKLALASRKKKRPQTIFRASKKSSQGRSSKPAPNNTGLPEISNGSKLLAVTPNWVLVKTKKGKTIKLRKGQKIYQGYLKEIRPNSNQVVFQMTSGSGSQNVVLSVNYKQKAGM